MEAVAEKAIGAVATTVATRLASEVVDDGIGAVDQKQDRKTKICLCLAVLVALLLAIFLFPRARKT
ncbi:unnamed protein product [Ectocarpus sp. 12 AP-2014]